MTFVNALNLLFELMWNIYIVNVQAKSTKNDNPSYTKKIVLNGLKQGWNLNPPPFRRAVETKAPQRVQFLLTFLGGRARSFGFTK